MINSIEFFSHLSKHLVNTALFLFFCGVCTSFFSYTSDAYESEDLFFNISQVNLDNIPNRADLRISDIAFDSAGRVYVCSRQGQVFFVFKRTVKEIKPNVNEDSTPWMPRGISTDQSNKLYVAGINHVWIFNDSGESVGGFDTDISYPTSIAVASDGMVYIAGHNKGYVLHQYAENGTGKPILEELTKVHREKLVQDNS